MDKDIQEMFQSKNREILITNLKFDLDKNVASLLDTITNIYNLEFDTAIKKIIAILNDGSILDADKFITDKINKVKIECYNSIEKQLLDKKNIILSKIDVLEFEESDMAKYYDLVFDSTKSFKEKLKEEAKVIFNQVDTELEEYIIGVVNEDNKELVCSRVTDYLNNRLYGKLETKVHMEVMLRDNNLINKAKEVYLRFQEITSQTIKN